jgi:hypothetical protein
MKTSICLALLALFFGWGCQAEEASLDDLKAPKAAFEGDVPERFAGTWKSEDGISTYRLETDGTYELHSKIRVQRGDPIDSRMQGEWRVKGDRMLFRDERGDVVPYAYALEDGRLELSLTGRMKSKTVLKRQ